MIQRGKWNCFSQWKSHKEEKTIKKINETWEETENRIELTATTLIKKGSIEHKIPTQAFLK